MRFLRGWRAFGGGLSVGGGRIGPARVCPRACGLRLDYYALKKRAEQQSAVVVPLRAKTGKAGKGARAVKAVKAGRAAGTTFLELPAAMPAGGCQYTLELEDADGAKMRVHVQGVQAPDLATLSRSFWNPTP
jgi:hypothetical protein